MRPFAPLRAWARTLRRDATTLWIAARDPRTLRLARMAAMAVAAYALSPIDLIPDIIPVLGYLDELLILPPAIALVLRLIPASLLAEFRRAADARMDQPRSRTAAVVIVAIWLGVAALIFARLV